LFPLPTFIMKTILITGGTGLLGSHLIPFLKGVGFRIHLLSRSLKPIMHCDAVFKWDVENGEIDERAFEGVTHIVHLAGEGIADGRWTESRMKSIISSRVKSAELILAVLQKRNQRIDVFVSGSAVGWYGAKTDNQLHTEDESPESDFMGETCRLWEEAADEFDKVSSRIVKVRTGIVLAKESGAFPKLIQPFRMHLGAALGSGNQQMPWIHIDDIVQVFYQAITNESWSGEINASATESCSNLEFSKTLAKTLGRILLPIHVPAIFLKMLLGDMSVVVLEGSRVSNSKLKKQGFQFKYEKLEDALNNLIE
jgi:uncharacterized protein (TIGR01777 family)